ncbi:glutaminase [Thioalkalivibrio denitrificans]|uniref:Glutaminase n=1 Tax=Thioalkalivibrio denitrificans TaxID=108003 RepID=A0A1V3N6V5_9GAMM|nr:glutaminase [Thioalkalivibrio denitrificans]OOG20628.1 glutaminase [Thioalkalivibrio denitrificans]
MDTQSLLEEIALEARGLLGGGRVADYIPELARVDPDRFGMALCRPDGEQCSAGDAEVPFSIQSISKVFTLTLALQIAGDKLWQRIGREPSGSAFNSLVQLEQEQGIPRNPFINAGALVVTDVIGSRLRDARGKLLEFMRGLCGNDGINFDEAVAQSEQSTGHRNAALAHFLRSFGNLENAPETVLDAYFHQCALAMSCIDVARAGLFLANGGVLPSTGERVIPAPMTKRINALMQVCGTYDSAGDFAYRVGLPAKSGVGGGILAVLPGHFSLCVWSPELDASGNSLAGTRALELFTMRTGLSVF